MSGLVKFTPSGKLVKHGGAGTAYEHYKCRCTECKLAHSERINRRRKERDPNDAPWDSHGKVSTYKNWNCRCEACTQANTEDSRKTYRKIKKRERMSKGA